MGLSRGKTYTVKPVEGEEYKYTFDMDKAMYAKGLIFEGLIDMELMKEKDPVSKSENTVTYAYYTNDMNADAYITYGTGEKKELLGEKGNCA